jgi:hypothetical protein
MKHEIGIVQAPRVAECSISQEYRLEWHRPLYKGADNVFAVPGTEGE